MPSQHFGFSAQRIILAVVSQGGGEATTLFFTDLRERTQVAKTILLVMDMVIGDVVIVCSHHLPNTKFLHDLQHTDLQGMVGVGQELLDYLVSNAHCGRGNR